MGDIRERIARTVGKQRFALWFQDTCLDLSDGVLDVGVPNLFFQEWLHAKFADVLAEAAAQIVGHDVQVTFHVDGELFRRMRRKQEADEAGVEQAADTNTTKRAARRPAACRRSTLTDFVVGTCNRLAHSAALEVVEAPGRTFNPLVIHGGVGLGKTHVLAGIHNALVETRSDLRVRYISAEGFANEYVRALRANEMERFRTTFRRLNVLIVDDVQFLADKGAMQDEFLHTFNALDAEGQIVVACDAHPRLLTGLGEALINRFLAGMVVRLGPLDPDVRVAILNTKAARFGKAIAPDVIRYIANRVQGSVRELEGALHCAAAHAAICDGRLTLAKARDALDEMIAQSVRVIQLKDIEHVVCHFFGLDQKQLRSNKRVRSISYPRMVGMSLARKHTRACYAEIGKFFGNKNHTTVISAEKTVARWLEEKATLKIGDRQFDAVRLVAQLERELQS